MRRLTLRHAALAAVVPLAFGSLAACGSSDSTHATDPQAGSSSSVVPTTPKGGSSITPAAYLKLLQTAMSSTTTAHVSMTGEVSGGSYTMKGAMDLTGDKPAMDITMHMGSAGLTGEVRLVDGTMYMSLGALTQGKFVKIDLEDPNGPLGSLGSTFDQLDPGKFAAQMKPGAFRSITFVGSDRFGRHYHATSVTAKSSTIFKDLPPSVTSNLPKTAGYDTWLDSQGRLSRIIVSVPTYMKMTMSYTDYGAPVHVTAPPASQITTMPGSSSSL